MADLVSMLDRARPAPVTPTKSSSKSGIQPKYQSTPIIRKLSGNPNKQKSLLHVHMDPALKEELFESQLLDVPRLVEHLFPNELIPLPFDDLKAQIKEKNNGMFCQWNQKVGKRKTPVDLDGSGDSDEKNIGGLGTGEKLGDAEKALAAFLNAMSAALVEICNDHTSSLKLPPARQWVSESNKSLRDGPKAKRKPDVNLVKEGAKLSWKTVLVSVELKSKEEDHGPARLQLINSAYMVFSTQDERRFHIGVSFCGDYVRVFVFDRAGVIGSQKIHVRDEWETFVRLIAGLTLADLDSIGLDSSIRHDLDGRRFVTVEGKEYEIIKTLFISDTIRGRGTVCWHARCDSIDYVIKNTWTDISRRQTEADIMRLAGDLEGISRVVAEEIVQFRGRDDSTAHIRKILDQVKKSKLRDWYDNLEIRVHRRLVVTPLAEGLAHFRSKKELLSVMVDAIEAHRRLFQKHILHRDVSNANIMIHRPQLADDAQTEGSHGNLMGDSSPSPSEVNLASPSLPPGDKQKGENRIGKGILIDLDYALVTHDADGNKLDREGATTGDRTGTLPFMALQLLQGLADGEEQRPHHDLESFFFVLLWICWHYAGPNNAERQNFNIMKTVLKNWVKGDDFREIGFNKAFAMHSPKSLFDLAVTANFSPYFLDLKPCVERLRRKIFTSEDTDVEYQDVIDILRDTMKDLPDDDNWSQKDDPEGYKRKLDTVEEEEDADDDGDVFQQASASRASKRHKTAPSKDVRLRRQARLGSR